MSLRPVTLGAVHLDKDTNAAVVQALESIGEGDFEPFGEVPMYNGLGLTSLPAPADKKGYAEGLMDDGIANAVGVITNTRDTRTADVVAKLKPGETCLHSTGEDFDSRVFCKDQMVAVVVGDDLAFVLDRKNKKVSLAAFGLMFEMSEKNGIVLDTGGAGLTLKGSVAHLRGGSVILGGMSASPVSAVHYGPIPVVSASGAVSTPAFGVFIGL